MKIAIFKMSSYRAVPYSEVCETFCRKGGEDGDPAWAFTIEYPVTAIMDARHIFSDYHHSWGYFQISFGDELKFAFSVHDPATRQITDTIIFECQPSSQGDLYRKFQRRLEELNYTLKTRVNMLKVRVIPRGPYRHSSPAAMSACLCGPGRFPSPCFSTSGHAFFSRPHDSIQILHDALKKQKAEEKAMAGIKVMSSVKFPTFTSESINPIISEDSDDQEENDALGRGKRGGVDAVD